MRFIVSLAVGLAIVVLLHAGFAAQKVVPRGSRILAVDVGMAEDNDYNAAFAKAKAVGMQDIGLSQDWSDIETSPGSYNGQWFAIANSYYPKTNTAVTVTLRPVHNWRKMVPADLKDVRFSDPRMIARFEKLLDFMFSQMPDTKLDALVIGSEFDVYLGMDPALWKDFTIFYKAVGAYARKKHPGLKIAAESTLKGFTGPAKIYLKDLNKASDLIGVSHYPLGDGFAVQDPKVVGGIFDKLVAAYPDKKICFYQWGYPSSPVLNSSEDKQAQFIRETFKAWDRHATHVLLVDFTWLHDLPDSALSQNAKYFGLSDPKFLAFLQTLGLRTYQGSGKDKESYRVLKSEAFARGWGR
jgi:hypothetical protein